VINSHLTINMAKEKFDFYLPEEGNFTGPLLDDSICTINNCTFSAGFMDFTPSLSVNAFFLAIFGTFIIPQLYFGIKHRTVGFTSTLLVGLALEVVGYAGAIQVHFNPATLPPALIGLTLGPTFIAAAVYCCLEYLRHIYDPENRITTRWARIYTWVFWTFSLIGLGMQIAGAVLAGKAENKIKAWLPLLKPKVETVC
jgi:hypothetical protein